MNELDVSVEGLLLAEVLAARGKTGAEEVRLCGFMRLLVLFQALGCVETFVTVWPITDIVSDIIMFGFDVVLQVALAEKGLITALLRTSKGTIICVRALVFLETDRTRVGLGAAFKVAGVFVLARIGLRFGGSGRRGLSRGTRGSGRRGDREGIIVVLVVVIVLAGCWKLGVRKGLVMTNGSMLNTI